MTITAIIVADSISEEGKRITTLQLRYPKFIHGEFMTHRVFSRNAASSRAIPIERVIKDVLDDPAMPVHWGKNQKGMQADEELTPEQIADLEQEWLAARDDAVFHADRLMKRGLHKQIANRVLEPFFHINTLVTSTEWDNFFELRCHKDAQPEMRVLAEEIRTAMTNSTPCLLSKDDWHLPYVTDDELHECAHYGIDLMDMVKLSVARCARVSYLTQDGRTPTTEEDLALYHRLVVAEPLHASPAEHQATPDAYNLASDLVYPTWRAVEHHRNFVGWKQYRSMLEEQVGAGA